MSGARAGGQRDGRLVVGVPGPLPVGKEIASSCQPLTGNVTHPPDSHGVAGVRGMEWAS